MGKVWALTVRNELHIQDEVRDNLFDRYEGGATFEPNVALADVAEFGVLLGLYSVEAILAMLDDYEVNDMAIKRVE